MDEDHQREEAIFQGVRRQEIARNRLAEERQVVEPLGRHDGDILGELVPDQPVAAHAGYIDQYENRNASQPAEPPHAPIAVERKLAQQMDEHHDDEAVGGIAVEAPHQPRCVPLIAGHVLDRIEGLVDAGAEENEEVDATRHDDPVEEKTERAEIEQRIPLRRKGLGQPPLRFVEDGPQRRRDGGKAIRHDLPAWTYAIRGPGSGGQSRESSPR